MLSCTFSCGRGPKVRKVSLARLRYDCGSGGQQQAGSVLYPVNGFWAQLEKRKRLVRSVPRKGIGRHKTALPRWGMGQSTAG